MPTFVLVHSPLVGPLTWQPVAGALRARGVVAIVPVLRSQPGAATPYWQQHSAAVRAALGAIGANEPVVLVGHSGAGPLMPAIRQALPQPVVAYGFVDANLPRNGMSRLALFGDAAEVARFRAAATDGLLPTWRNLDLAPAIPDATLRARFVAELRPLPLAVYEEPLPVFPTWPDAPCAFLQFSPIYDAAAQQARERGWPGQRLEGGHFHMLVEPEAVAEALLTLAAPLAGP